MPGQSMAALAVLFAEHLINKGRIFRTQVLQAQRLRNTHTAILILEASDPSKDSIQ